MMNRNGFTLIELLVVISIIALLIGILLPVLGRARKTAQALESLSNTRQWGVVQLMFAGDNRDFLAWDGEDSPADASGTPYGDTGSVPYWWANALPPYVGQERFLDMDEPPMPGGEKHIFVDQSAAVPPGAPYPVTVDGQPYSFFFCYVPNSKLDSSAGEVGGVRRSRLVDIPKPSLTAMMLEKRTVADEVPADDPFRGKSLDRAKADWQRFAARHDNGGHILFADGHGAHVRYTDATARHSPDYVSGPLSGFNTPSLIWDPLGRAN